MGIGEIFDPEEELDQILEFSVLLVVVEGENGDPVEEVVPKGVDCVVDQQYVIQLPIGEDTEIFDENAFWSLYAVFPE